MNETTFLDLISGRRTGMTASLLRGLLRGMSWGYALGVTVRNLAWDRGWSRTFPAKVPVISLGNLTTGGTGKTPLAAYLARQFREESVRVTFLSRGYGAGNETQSKETQNDEARVLAQLCPDVPHLQARDRVASAAKAVSELDSQLLILDDGFQHRRLRRDLDIVLIDALNPWGYNALLPRGLLRESVAGLRRAHLAVITRVDLAPPKHVATIRQQINDISPQLPCAEVAYVPKRLVSHSGKTASFESLLQQGVVACCGIGNPEAFRQLLERQLKFRLLDFQAYPDHHRYTSLDIAHLATWAESTGAAAIVMTQKDLVKIPHETLGNSPVWGVELGTRIVAGEDNLQSALDDIRGRIQEFRDEAC